MVKDSEGKESTELEELLYSQNESFIIFIKSVLDSAGIEYIVREGSLVHLRHAIPARFYVKKEDFKKAQNLLKDYL